MTDKVKEKWYSLNTKYKFLVILAICMALLSVPIMAFAGIGISFSGQTPANGTITGNSKPTISIIAKASEGTVNQEDISMSINDAPVTPVLNSSTGIISYTPTVNMDEKSHNVKVGVKDSNNQEVINSWNFTVDAVPNPSSWSPGKNAKISNASPTLSLYVKDRYDDLDTSSIVVKLDNQIITHKWNDVTHIYNPKEGTITAATNNLSDGPHTVEFQIADKLGNILKESWTFTIAEPPKFGSLNPADQSKHTKVSQVSAVITDNSSIDWTTLEMLLNGKLVTPIVDQNTGVITYSSNLATNSYKATLKVRDKAGTLGTKTWDFIADDAPPSLDYLFDFTDGMIIEDGKLKIRLGLKDLVTIKDNATLSLNGTPLDINFRYDGYVDSYTGQWRVTATNKAHIEYEKIVANGTHTLKLASEDELGTKMTKTWTFTVSTKPNISGTTPTKYGLTDLTPVISAVAKSPNGTIDSSKIVLKLDGNVVEHGYDSNTGKITYTPSKALANESYHTVDLTIADTKGVSESSSWKFYITTYPDMPDSNISNCTSCHALTEFENSNGPFEEIHAAKLWFEGGHNNNKCANCHDYITQPASCQQCHGDNNENAPHDAPHGSTPAIKYSAKNFKEPLRVLENREMWDCIICHQPGAQTKGYVDRETTPTRLLKNHDIPELHKNISPDFADCNKCHAQSLTREHTRDGRTDNNGKQISCKTCHESTDSKVKEAIANDKKDCISCHSNADHNELHTYKSLNASCMNKELGCHSNTLTTEHKNRGLTCESCHESSSNPDYSPSFKQGVNLAITWGQLSCSNCHNGQVKHGVNFAKAVPDGLKYPDLEWNSPESLDFWTKESWVPSDMAGGLYAISKRKSNLVKTDVLNYYQSKMQELGWKKVEGPGSQEEKFELIYTKGTAKTIIRFYNTENYNASTNLEAGHRVEILYK